MNEPIIHPVLASTEAQVVADLANQAGRVQKLEPGELYSVLGPGGESVIVDTDHWDLIPRRNTSWPLVRDAAALIDYVAAYPNAGPLEAYADLDNHRFVVIIDGHDSWRGHRVTLQLATSPEWRAWTEISGKFLGQVEFAEFLEDHISSIAEPDGAALLDIVNTLVGTSSVTWTGGENTRDGSKRLAFAETVEARAGHKGDIELPSTLTLGLRPFMGSDRFSVKAMLRFRMANGELHLAVKLLEPDTVLEAAFGDVRAALADGLPYPIMSGTPDHRN